MAAQVDLSMLLEVSGLGQPIIVPKKTTDGTAPTAKTHQYRTLATADTAEALDMGDISTVQGIVLWAIDYDVDVDTSYVSSFVAEQTAEAAELPVVIINPSGTVYVKNNGSSETPAYEYVAWGTT